MIKLKMSEWQALLSYVSLLSNAVKYFLNTLCLTLGLNNKFKD